MFKSLDEYIFAKQCEQLDIDYQYEPFPILLDKGFTTLTNKTYRDMKYTPDFVIKDKLGNKVVVEIKGFYRFDDPVKYRLANKILQYMDMPFYKISLKGSQADNTKGFYDFSNSFKSKKLVNKYKVKQKRLSMFFYKSGLISLEKEIPPLKLPKRHKYNDIYDLMKKEVWENIGEYGLMDDHAGTNEEHEAIIERLESKYNIIGTKKQYCILKEEQDGK